LNALQADHAGEFEKGHAQLKKDRLQGAILDIVKIAASFFRENAKQVNGGAGTQDVDARTLSILGSSSHLDHGGEVKLLH
jgi:hypothetical protein